MRPEDLRIGMKVRHPQYGEGVVKAITEALAEIHFDLGTRSVAPEPSGLEPAEPSATLQSLSIPLSQIIRETVDSTIDRLGVQRLDREATQLAGRWHKGRMVLHPSDPTLQTKEVPLENFFHKIVMVRNQLRVLEQKVNGHEKLTDAEKVELQQYVTRCYGSMTTFNVFFMEKEDQF